MNSFDVLPGTFTPDQCGSRDEQPASATAPLTFKGTPGPWSLKYAGRVVASCGHVPVWADVEPMLNEAECAANAHLIAAAPDLLKAAQAAFGLLREEGWSAGPTGRALADAIAKATGAPQ